MKLEGWKNTNQANIPKKVVIAELIPGKVDFKAKNAFRGKDGH